MVKESQMNSKSGSLYLENTYIKDLSFEAPHLNPNAPLNSSSRFDAEFKVNVTQIEENRVEVCLSLTGKGINGESEETIYIVEVIQAGVFLINGDIDEESMKEITLTECPANLFPYLREVVDSILAKSGFPPLRLAGIDFNAGK